MSEEKNETVTEGPRVGVCSNTGIHHVGLYAKDPAWFARTVRHRVMASDGDRDL
jgi:hypothetical protein